MIVRYSTLRNLEIPKFTLCNPGSVYNNNNGVLTKVVGMLVDHEAEEIVFNFNATSELNMRVNRVPREDPEENEYVYSLYKSLQNRRLIFVEDIGYFAITNINDGFDGKTHYKDVTAKSVDIEIAQKMIPFIADGTYRFTTDKTGTNKGILETIVETLPLWTIGEVDEAVANRWRTFEDVDTSLNCQAFLLENVQDAFECIVLFDCINRIINVYDQANYVKQTDIHITKHDLINTLDITENADDLYTAISVLGNENISIAALNPLGTNVIYNFNYYLDWMSAELATKVRAWQTSIDEQMDDYYTLNVRYYEQLEEANNLNMEIEALATQIKMYSRCRDNIIAEAGTSLVDEYNTIIVENGGTAITIGEEIEDTLASIDNLIAECESQQENVATELDKVNVYLVMYQEDIKKIHEALAITNYFTDNEQEELNHYIFEGSYTDEYVTITDIMTYSEKFEQMKTLYDRAKTRLDRVSQPTQEFNVDVENFIFIKEFEQWSEQLETGCLINVELNTNDIALLFLSNITINYDDRALNMTFGNRFNKFDPKSLFDNVLGDVSKSANTLNYIKEILYPIKNGEFNAMKEALQTSRNLTMQSALSSTDEEVMIDGSGYTSKKRLDTGAYDPRQIKITGKNIVFTDDAWETCKTAIGELLLGDGASTYGINAETIIGDIIIGHNLRIVDSNGNDILTVVDDKVSSSVGDINDKLTEVEQTNDSLNIRISNVESLGVDSVTTANGFTFNKEGLTIYEVGEQIENLLSNQGMSISRINGDSKEIVLKADDEGVDAINLTARQYLIVGANSRFEDYDNGTDSRRTACFYIGS